MFIITYWTLVHSRPFDRPLNKSMLSVAILMFVLTTMVSSHAPTEPAIHLKVMQQLGVNFTRAIRALVIFQDSPKSYWNQLSEPTQVFGSALYIIQTFVGDSVAVRQVSG